MKFRRTVGVLIAGLCALLVALAFSELVTYPAMGFRVDITKMPAEAQAILNESKGAPRTAEQWRRVEKVLYEHGWSDRRELFFRGPLNSWYWYLVSPIIASFVLRRRWKTLTRSEFFLLCSPCAVFLIIARVSVPL